MCIPLMLGRRYYDIEIEEVPKKAKKAVYRGPVREYFGVSAVSHFDRDLLLNKAWPLPH